MKVAIVTIVSLSLASFLWMLADHIEAGEAPDKFLVVSTNVPLAPLKAVRIADLCDERIEIAFRWGQAYGRRASKADVDDALRDLKEMNVKWLEEVLRRSQGK